MQQFSSQAAAALGQQISWQCVRRAAQILGTCAAHRRLHPVRGEPQLQLPQGRAGSCQPCVPSMLSGDMQEGRTAEVEVKEAVPEAVELLLTHIYGGEMEVPLPLALQLYALADRYQLKSDLAQQLRLWLGTIRVEPAALCQQLPAAHTVCPHVCQYSWYSQAAAAVGEIRANAAFLGWQIGVVQSIMQHVTPADAFKLAAAWVEVQQQGATAASASAQLCRKRGREGDGKYVWPDALLNSIKWGDASREDLRVVRTEAERVVMMQEIPGLYQQLYSASEKLCSRQDEQLKRQRRDQKQQVQELRQQVQLLQQQVQVLQQRLNQRQQQQRWQPSQEQYKACHQPLLFG